MLTIEEIKDNFDILLLENSIKVKMPRFKATNMWQKLLLLDFIKYVEEKGFLKVGLPIHIKRMKKRQHTFGYITLGEDGKVNPVNVDFDAGLNVMLNNLIHELKHLEQIYTKRLSLKGNQIFWKNKEFMTIAELTDVMRSGKIDDYKKLPWEKEAYATSTISKNYLKNIENRNLRGKDKYLDWILDNAI